MACWSSFHPLEFDGVSRTDVLELSHPLWMHFHSEERLCSAAFADNLGLGWGWVCGHHSYVGCDNVVCVVFPVVNVDLAWKFWRVACHGVHDSVPDLG